MSNNIEGTVVVITGGAHRAGEAIAGFLSVTARERHAGCAAR
jgi:hypothetical protein